MVQGQFPFEQAVKDSRLYELFTTDKEQYFANVDKNNSLSNEFKDLIFTMLAKDPCQRGSIECIKNHAWITENNQDQNELRQIFLNEVSEALISVQKQLPEEDFKHFSD